MKYIIGNLIILGSVALSILALVIACASIFGFGPAIVLFIFCLPGMFAHIVIGTAGTRAAMQKRDHYFERKAKRGW